MLRHCWGCRVLRGHGVWGLGAWCSDLGAALGLGLACRGYRHRAHDHTGWIHCSILTEFREDLCGLLLRAEAHISCMRLGFRV